jgi:hypothetical protein
VRSQFALWRRCCFGDDKPVHLVQDHERCLWQDRNLVALKEAGLTLVTNFPKCSPDLNAIEGWWHRLRDLLEERAPVEMESREDFIRRLRRTVTWMNANLHSEALKLATNQKQRVADVKKARYAKSKW